MVEPCGVCGHRHEYEIGEMCGMCGHRKPGPSEMLLMQSPPSEIMKSFYSMFGYGYQTIEGLQTKGISRIPNDTRPTSEETPTKISVRTFVSTVSTSASRAEATQSVPSAAPVTEEEIRNFLMSTPPVTVLDFLSTYMPRMKSHEEMRVFAKTVRRISKSADVNGRMRVVLREK
ncbi:hypothetical protein J5N97_026357 [Dioscorea zingiberensis]|uniref:Transcription initiation factor IIF subunit alpha n=1 Tax=Dioscorea zingiberensis TaxID=325984 RepID=A0A9D5C359_9LILI|nr:hypothetical protein J5N97_026357 [Dioscorea zingiberensis]